MKFVLNERVFVLTQFDEYDPTVDAIMGIFKTKESAIAYRNEFIRETYDVPDDIPDEELEIEVEAEFNIESYWVQS